MLGRLSPFLAVAIAALSTLGAAQSAPNAGVVAGRVVEAGTNAPVADARVMLSAATRPTLGQIPQAREAASGPDGAFRFEGLEPGPYRLTVQKAGFVGSGPATPPRMITIEAGGGPVAPVVTMERGAVITGRVLTPKGEPMADARVSVFSRPTGAPAGRLMMAGPAAVTNDLGEFRVHSLAAGEYFIQAIPRPLPPMARTDPSATTVAATFYPGTVDPSAAQPLSIGRSATLNGVDIAMLEVPAFSVRGVVVDEAGRPVENASVMLMPDPRIGISWGPGRARSSADGQFRIDGIVEGTYLLRAAAPAVTKDSTAGAVNGPVSGIVGPITSGMSSSIGGGGPSGPAFMTETAGGVTTTYRFDESQQLRIRVDSAEVTGLQIIVKRTQP